LCGIDKEHILQSSQERPPPSTRPSLLATDTQEENASQRLLAGVDASPAPRADGARPKRRRTAWLAGLLALAAGGGTAAWMNSAPDEQVAVAPPARTIAPVAPRAPEAPEVSTAAILQDTPAADEKPAVAKADTAALTALLESKPAVTPKPPKPHDEAKARSQKLAAREHAKKNAEQHPFARDVLAKKKPAPEVDSDVALLAALVAHAKVAERAAPSPDPRKLKACNARPSAAEADACRARLCAGTAKNSTACKPARVVDAS
jgi:hypothetical protein